MALIFWKLLALLGVVVFVIFAIVLEDEFGFPFSTTYRIACAGIGLVLMLKVCSNYPGQRWPWIGLSIAVLVDIGLFITPWVDRPGVRRELLLLIALNATIFLAARTVSYPVTDAHQRAVRQQLVVGLILAIAFCIILLGPMFLPTDIIR